MSNKVFQVKNMHYALINENLSRSLLKVYGKDIFESLINAVTGSRKATLMIM